VKRNLRKVGRAERVVFGYGNSDVDSSALEEVENDVGNMHEYFEKDFIDCYLF